ncbi:hypothetical protein J6590_102496, partial [Homalodisca vitripennis]
IYYYDLRSHHPHVFSSYGTHTILLRNSAQLMRSGGDGRDGRGQRLGASAAAASPAIPEVKSVLVSCVSECAPGRPELDP